MRYYKDMREHLKALEEKGKLIRFKSEVDKDTELHPIVRLQFRGLPEEERKAFLFENVVDTKGRKYKMPVAVGALAASIDVYAIGMMCKPEEIADKWEQALSHPIEPIIVPQGVCQEVVHMGADLDKEGGGLDMLPIPISTPGYDNAPYFTCANWVTKDPETGIRNIGNYRAQIKSRRRTGAAFGKSKDAYIHWMKAVEKGQPLEAAVVIGAAPCIPYVAVQPIPYNMDEFAVAGALAGEPIELVKCKTVDLEVPATAEIVIEGIVSTEYLEPEGPFGESYGYIDTPQYKQYFEVTCITHRKNAIYTSFISQLTPSESSKIKEPGYEAMLLRHLREECSLTGVTKVAMLEPLSNLRPYIVIQMKKKHPSEPWRAMHGILSKYFDIGKTIVVVDEDIDPKDPEAVNWAISYRMQPDTDVEIAKGRLLGMKWTKLVEKGKNVGSALLIDATRKGDLPPISLPHKQYMERAIRMWEKEGLPKIRLKKPWHGYSLSPWPEELIEEGELAVKGEYYKTGEKHVKRRKKPEL